MNGVGIRINFSDLCISKRYNMQMPNRMFSSLLRHLVQLAFRLGLLCLPVVSHAVIVDDLYLAEVLVADESAGQLRTGARAGLLQVLVRVSGSQEVQESSLIRTSLRNPAAYYYQYSYESSDKSLVMDGNEVNARTLKLHFEPSAVARLLRDAGLPVWGSNRPAVMLWIAVNDNDGRRILGEGDVTELAETLRDQAAQRGVPLLFPILDLEDAAQISTAEVWGAFLERIEAASVRYEPDVILTGRIQQEAGGRWSARWAFDAGSGWLSVEGASFSADGLLRDMIDQLSNDLASRFALGSSKSRVTLAVEGVSTVSDYADLSAYLEQLTPVLGSSIVSLAGDLAEFDLRTEGQYEQLVDIIELDGRLQLLSNDQAGQRLRYRWTR